MRTQHLMLLVGALIISAVVTTSVFAKEKDRSPEVVPDQYIVVLKDAVVSDDTEDAVVSEMEGKHKFIRDAVFKKALKGFAAKLTKAQVEKLKQDPRVEFVSEDRVVSIDAKPGDVVAQAQTLPTGVNRINAENKTNKGAGVNVAIIDTGIDTTHPDLAANIAGGKNCNGFGSSYKDGNGHGTHVAGTIAALDNGVGVVGVAPKAKLWAVRVLSNSGSGTWSQVICGLDYVTSKAPKNGGPITVANMSLGGAGVSDNNCGKTNNDALHKAICRARDAGVTVVVAGGNNGGPASGQVPAAYDDAVITVSALADSDGVGAGVGAGTGYGADDTFASFSNYGSPTDIGAPGVNIYSTWKGSSYATISGTSMASPHVAGAAALYIATHAGATWTQVRSALVAAGEAVGAGHTDPSGLHPEPVLRADTL